MPELLARGELAPDEGQWPQLEYPKKEQRWMGLQLLLGLSCLPGSMGCPSLCRQEAPGQAQPESLGPQTPMAIFLNSAGQGHRWESPDKQPSVAHGTIMTINWEPERITKSWSQAKCTLAVEITHCLATQHLPLLDG